MFAAAVLLGLIGVIAGIVALIAVARKNLVDDRRGVLIGMAICLVIVAVAAPQFVRGRSVPPIHNISTDVADPPVFSAIIPLRGASSNPVEYKADQLADVQQKAYPWVKPLETPMPPDQAFDRSMDVLKQMNIEVVQPDKASGIIEGTATSFWFGFKDDVVVRIRPEGTGSRVDLHSVSRVGVGDVGMNAKRIGEFLNRFNG
jgi:uncharacterized protein (DUF1499 family)